jgi:hypothetical protein
VGACREGCFHAQTPYITKSTPCTTRLPNTTPHSALASRSFSDQSTHPLTTPRPPTIVYPHRASSTPLTSASTPPHEPDLFLTADPTQRASSYVPLRVHRVTVAPTPSYVVGGERGAAEAARAGKLRSSCGRECDEGARDPGGHSSFRLPGGDSACRACRDDDANQLGIRQHRLASQRRRGQRVR